MTNEAQTNAAQLAAKLARTVETAAQRARHDLDDLNSLTALELELTLRDAYQQARQVSAAYSSTAAQRAGDGAAKGDPMHDLGITRPFHLTTPAQPISQLFLLTTRDELDALTQEARDAFAHDEALWTDLAHLSNVSRDEDIERSGFLTWWYQHADWDAYRADESWTQPDANRTEHARWELARIYHALAPHGRAFLDADAVNTAPTQLADPVGLLLDDIDVTSYIRFRMGFRGISGHLLGAQDDPAVQRAVNGTKTPDPDAF